MAPRLRSAWTLARIAVIHRNPRSLRPSPSRGETGMGADRAGSMHAARCMGVPEPPRLAVAASLAMLGRAVSVRSMWCAHRSLDTRRHPVSTPIGPRPLAVLKNQDLTPRTHVHTPGMTKGTRGRGCRHSDALDVDG